MGLGGLGEGGRLGKRGGKQGYAMQGRPLPQAESAFSLLFPLLPPLTASEAHWIVFGYSGWGGYTMGDYVHMPLLSN